MKTLKELHKGVVQQANALYKEKITAVIEVLGANGIQTFYDVVSNRRKLSPAEKEAIAKIYGVTVADIDWQDVEKVIA